MHKGLKLLHIQNCEKPLVVGGENKKQTIQSQAVGLETAQVETWWFKVNMEELSNKPDLDIKCVVRTNEFLMSLLKVLCSFWWEIEFGNW